MIITQIKRIGNSTKFNVYVDDSWSGVFSDEILARYHLKTGQEIDEEEFLEIKKENDEKVSFDIAVGYIEKYVVSEKGVRDYLKKKNFSINVIDTTIEKLRNYGYVNDENFARNYFESMRNSKGKRVIANKLKEKGVAVEIVEQLLENVDDEGELEKATVLAEKFVKNRENSAKTYQKCIGHLIYKGYDYSVAQQATQVALSNKGETDDWI